MTALGSINLNIKVGSDGDLLFGATKINVHIDQDGSIRPHYSGI